ncbi:beta-ketoacyl-ACP synthase II [Candidatus Poribacteria bacterium]|nr:beta-ketoacyl-ACP synthase II [Candidatus Poribacteria bacterium]
MNRRRVVITGLGAIMPLGNTIQELWYKISHGISGIGKITKFDVAGFPSQVAGEVRNFDPNIYSSIDKKDIKRMGVFLQYGLAASELAIKHANFDLSTLNKKRVGTIIGSGMGDLEKVINENRTLEQKGIKSVTPTFVPTCIPNMSSAIVSIKFRFQGPSIGIASACATGTHSIGEAFRKIQYNEADVMICGGTEGALFRLGFAGFCASRTLTSRIDEPEKASRPFDRDRDGFAMSEGAGIVVLEDLDHAKKRDAKIYAEIIGYGASCDAYHIAAPDPEGNGAVMAMENAISDAHILPNDIEYINAHGTSTPLNDKLETLAIKRLFKDQAYKIPISSTKSMTGHLINATGAIEVIISALSINEGLIPPTINYETPDPECDLDYVPNIAREKKLNIVMTNSFGFGGQNAVLVLKKLV